MRIAMIGTSLLLVAWSPTIACSWDSPTARMPGFSDAEAEQRTNQLKTDWDIITHYMRTNVLSEEAQDIYLGKVAKADLDDERYRWTTVVEPLRAIKGKLPTGEQTLVGFLPNSCDSANGDGDGVYTKKGDLIIVFMGVSKRDDRPNGIDSVRVSEVRNLKLLDAVQAWLNTLPDYEPYD